MSDKKNETAGTAAAETNAGTPAKDPNQISVTLDTPLKRGEQTIDKVILRKPQSGELRGLKLAEVVNMDVTSMTVLLPRITSPTLTSADVAALDPADLLQLAAETASFFLRKADRASLEQ